jgi:hypothetical protein
MNNQEEHNNEEFNHSLFDDIFGNQDAPNYESEREAKRNKALSEGLESEDSYEEVEVFEPETGETYVEYRQIIKEDKPVISGELAWIAKFGDEEFVFEDVHIRFVLSNDYIKAYGWLEEISEGDFVGDDEYDFEWSANWADIDISHIDNSDTLDNVKITITKSMIEEVREWFADRDGDTDCN